MLTVTRQPAVVMRAGMPTAPRSGLSNVDIAPRWRVEAQLHRADVQGAAPVAGRVGHACDQAASGGIESTTIAIKVLTTLPLNFTLRSLALPLDSRRRRPLP